MINILPVALLFLFSCITSSHAFLNEGEEGGAIPGIPIIPIQPSPKAIVNVKIDVKEIKVDIDKRQICPIPYPNYPGVATPISTPTLDATTPVFPDPQVGSSPANSETVLGELSGNVTTQGLPGIGLTDGLLISSFTYTIDKDYKGQVPIVSFIIRGKGFDITSGLDANLVKQLGALLEPRVYLGNICLKVCKFADDYIVARFEDIDDQKNFKPGTYVASVKVLHVLKKIPIVGPIDKIGALTIPELSIIGPAFPILPITTPILSNPLISLFKGLKFDVAELSVIFSVIDADKISKAAKDY